MKFFTVLMAVLPALVLAQDGAGTENPLTPDQIEENPAIAEVGTGAAPSHSANPDPGVTVELSSAVGDHVSGAATTITGSGGAPAFSAPPGSGIIAPSIASSVLASSASTGAPSGSPNSTPSVSASGGVNGSETAGDGKGSGAMQMAHAMPIAGLIAGVGAVAAVLL